MQQTHRRLMSDEDWARRPDHIAPGDWARIGRRNRDLIARPTEADRAALDAAWAADNPTVPRASVGTARQRYVEWRDQGATVDQMAEWAGVQRDTVTTALRRAEAAHPQPAPTRHAVRVETAEGPDVSWAPRDAADPGAWTADRAAMWNRIGVPAQAVELTGEQLDLFTAQTDQEASL